MDRKSLIIMLLLLAVVVIIIVDINYADGGKGVNGNATVNNSENLTNEEVIKCIGEKAKLIVSPTCGYCAGQKQDLTEYYGDYADYIEVIDISEHPEILQQYDISGVPSWIIDEEVNSGYRPVNKIRELTGC
jgi:hypothetical protein